MKKRALTLLEIMIVILLITLITGVISYNMKGTLDKGKAFRTERAMEQLSEMLYLRQVETSKSLKDIVDNRVKELKEMELVKNADNFLRDGWGEPFEVTYKQTAKRPEEVEIVSPRFNRYQKEHGLNR